MNVFESLKKTAGNMSDAGEAYVKKTEDYLRLKVFQQLSISVSLVAKALIIGAFLFSGLIFLAFASAYAIGEYLNSVALGYLIVAGVFLMLSIIIYLKRSVINTIIIKRLSSKFFDS